jgi:hypothetical protein
MKLFSCVLMICFGLAAADPPAPPQTKKAPAAMTVPPDAVLVEPGLYHWTDKQGKGWMYRRTLFGVNRWEDTAENTKQKSIVESTTAVEEGDSIRFERQSPFGKRTWVHKKTELDETEQKIWARQQAKAAASRTADKE